MDWSWAPRSYLALVSTADLHLAVAKRVLRRVTRFVMNEGVEQHLERGREDSMPALRPWLSEFYLALAQLTASRIQFEEAISRAKAGASSQPLAKIRILLVCPKKGQQLQSAVTAQYTNGYHKSTTVLKMAGMRESWARVK